MQIFMDNPRVFVSTGFFIGIAIAVLLIPVNWLLAWFAAATMHELGHYIGICLCGCKMKEIKLLWNGILMKAEIHTRYEAICALLGPVLGALLISLYRWFPRVAICAFVQTFVNLLPLFPMDGGRVLHGFLRLFFSETLAQRMLQITAALVVVGIFYIMCRLQTWTLLSLLGVILLFKRGNIKIPCKAVRLRVQ